MAGRLVKLQDHARQALRRMRHGFAGVLGRALQGSVAGVLSRARQGRVAIVGAVLIGALIAWFVAGSVAGHVARRVAKSRGFDLTIGSSSLAPQGVRLQQLSLTAPAAPGIRIELDRVHVQLTWDLKLKSAFVEGGEIKLAGSREAITKQLDALRRDAGKRSSSDGSSNSPSYEIRGLTVAWESSEEEAVHAWGVRYERDREGELVAADRVQGHWRGSYAQLSSARAELQRIGGERKFRTLVSESLVLDLSLDALAVQNPGNTGQNAGSDASTAAAAAGTPRDSSASKPPADIARGARSGAAAARSGAAAARSDAAAARSDAAAARSHARGATAPDVNAGASRVMDIAGVRTALLEGGRNAGAKLAPGARVVVTGARLRVHRHAEVLNLGPARVELERAANVTELAITAGAAEQHPPLTFKARLPVTEGAIQFDLAGGPVSLGALGVREGDFGLTEVKRAQVEAKLASEFDAAGTTLAVSGSGTLSGASIKHPKLARDALSDINLAWRLKFMSALDGSHVKVEDAELAIGRTRLELKGEVRSTDERIAVNLQGGIPLASCQDMLDSAPRGLAPMLVGMKLTGTFALNARVAFDSLKPEQTESAVRFVNDCQITAVPAEVSPQRFASTFSYSAKDESGRSYRIHTGPETAGWARYENISRFMEVAVLVTEDGRFFRHRGFDQEAISNSLRDNLKTGKFLRGASTISMQLAKNLYLEREKTMARKLQEAVLTMLLEQELSKQEILELYLNVIEFGPGIYGVSAAAAHYFAISPSELSLAQSLYLASILPNPKASHFAADGSLRPGWAKYLRRLMEIARARDLITDAELQEGQNEQLTLGGRGPGGPKPANEADYDQTTFSDETGY